MDEDRRKRLKERRAFMQRRNAARAFREQAQPAVGALEAAGETFRLFDGTSTPRWSPDWIPKGYSYMPWSTLDDVVTSDQLLDGELAAHVAQLVYVRAKPNVPLLVIFEGRDITLECDREVFLRHAEAIMATCWYRAFIVQPPAQWLVHADGNRTLHKDH